MSAAAIGLRDTKDGGIEVELKCFATDGESSRAADLASSLVALLAKLSGLPNWREAALERLNELADQIGEGL